MRPRYEELWQLLKREGKAYIKLNKSLLENEDLILKRIKKAITKKKGNDAQFKRENPFSRISYTKVTKDGDEYLRLTLSHYIGDETI